MRKRHKVEDVGDENESLISQACVDGNEAVARVAYALSEVIAIYPITPASPMGEAADAWASMGKPNLWGDVPEVIEMQSEGGAAGALHGAIQRGALATTFTASQGLLLMLPNLFKIAGELSPGVLHVAARTVATHALSIFGDQSDVMAVRSAGWSMLCSSSPQEAQDLALIAHAATLSTRVPIIHFFDGFRTSHEMNKISLLSEDDLAALIDEDAIIAHRMRALSPERPYMRGTAQNPDVFFQAREASNPFYAAVPGKVAEIMDRFAERVGRRYHLVDYVGSPEAERVVVMMGSGQGATEEVVETLCDQGEKVGLVKVRLFRPFPSWELAGALPPTVRSIAVLDRTKEPGSAGEPLYQDVVTALAENFEGRTLPRITGGRYGLSSKEFTPAMAKGVFDMLASSDQKRHFTVGIVDDVSSTSIPYDRTFKTENTAFSVLVWGRGSDGSVSSAHAAARLVASKEGRYAQSYSVYDSRKAGSVTTTHLRFSTEPIRSSYLLQEADLVVCNQFGLLDQMDILEGIVESGKFLLNSPYGPDEVWDKLPVEVQEKIVDSQLDFYVVDAYKVAAKFGLGGYVNVVMLPCLLALSSVLKEDEIESDVRQAIEEEYGSAGPGIIARNIEAASAGLSELHKVKVPEVVTGKLHRRPPVPADAPSFVQRVTAMMLAGKGDLLPTSALPVDGTFPTGTAKYEKRGIALEIPIWDPSICIDCGKCAIVCPHAAIRMKAYDPVHLEGKPDTFQYKEFRFKELPGLMLTVQVAPDDCTGCGVCVETCPVKDKREVRHKAIDMLPRLEHLEAERANFEFFLTIPEIDRSSIRHDTVKTAELLEPLFEFSGACAGCGETPYLKLLTQLFGDRMLVANATGCSSIYGGNLPTTPWSHNQEGRGPAWSNSLFEDNAEFGLGMRLALDKQLTAARLMLEKLAPVIGGELVEELSQARQDSEAEIMAQRKRVEELIERLAVFQSSASAASSPLVSLAKRLSSIAEVFVRKSVWIVGGDGWAYDIGFGGLDHVLASGRDVNVLVLDTEVYSNTGGQASKATPRGAVAKFATAGNRRPKKDLGFIASGYGDVYVAQVALGANDVQTVKALLEADAWPGPSLVIAYSTCIAHGFDMSQSMVHQRNAVRSGYWPLYRVHPGTGEHEHPFKLDSHAPAASLREFMASEDRFQALYRRFPEKAERLLDLAEEDVAERWRLYEQLAGVERKLTGEAE
jgi:pyruvate-ferredoxin/flavodoxin oxidoreductase